MKSLRQTVEAQAQAHMRHVRHVLKYPHDFTLCERLSILNRWRDFRRPSARSLHWRMRKLHSWTPVHTLANLSTHK